MGLFKKKEEKETEIPRLPDLPKLPEFPEYSDIKTDSDELISQLPSFPSGTLGDKFSRYNIKEAVTGEKEEEAVDEFAEESREKMQMTQKPLVREMDKKETFSRFEKTKEAEPLFIRIDKFEEGSKTFEEVKRQVSEIEKMFSDLKSVKENEEKELNSFEDELRTIKEKLEKINNNIFSKIE